MKLSASCLILITLLCLACHAEIPRIEIDTSLSTITVEPLQTDSYELMEIQAFSPGKPSDPAMSKSFGKGLRLVAASLPAGSYEFAIHYLNAGEMLYSSDFCDEGWRNSRLYELLPGPNTVQLPICNQDGQLITGRFRQGPELNHGRLPNNPASESNSCHYNRLEACSRGIYVSTQNSLGNPQREQELLAYIKKNNIKVISLYDLEYILRNPIETDELRSFMERARAFENLEIEAIAGTNREDWDLIAKFHRSHLPFDALLTEIEFWHGTESEVSHKFAEYLEILKYLHKLQLSRENAEPVKVKTYLGWFNQKQAAAIIQEVDEVYLHAYVQDAAKTFEFTRSRLALLDQAIRASGKNISIKPIFSAEGSEQQGPGGEPFMGEWIKNHHDPLNTADALYLKISARSDYHPYMAGTQYFLYDILKYYFP